MLRMSMGIMNGERRPGPLLRRMVLLGGGVQAADARAEEHAHLVAVHLVQVHPESSRA
jgi:hypothetical protein